MRLAREWAGLGFFVFRIDISGNGESLTKPGSLENDPYPRGAVAEVREAMSVLSKKTGAEFVLAGLCSGADIALQAAWRDRRARGLVMLNPRSFCLDPLHFIEDETKVYRADAGRRPTAAKLKAFGRMAARRLKTSVEKTLKRPDTALATPALAPAQFRALDRRGVRTLLVAAKGDPGIEYMDLRFGRRMGALERLTGFRRVNLEGCDHVFTMIHARARWPRRSRAISSRPTDDHFQVSRQSPSRLWSARHDVAGNLRAASLGLNVVEYSLVAFLQLFLVSLGYFDRHQIPSVLVPLSTMGTLGLCGLLVLIGTLRTMGLFLSNYSNDITQEIVTYRLKQVTLYEMLLRRGRQFLPASEVHFRIGELFPKNQLFIQGTLYLFVAGTQIMLLFAGMLYLAWRETLIGLLGLSLAGVLVVLSGRVVVRIALLAPRIQENFIRRVGRVSRNWLFVRISARRSSSARVCLTTSSSTFRSSCAARSSTTSCRAFRRFSACCCWRSSSSQAARSS